MQYADIVLRNSIETRGFRRWGPKKDADVCCMVSKSVHRKSLDGSLLALPCRTRAREKAQVVGGARMQIPDRISTAKALTVT